MFAVCTEGGDWDYIYLYLGVCGIKSNSLEIISDDAILITKHVNLIFHNLLLLICISKSTKKTTHTHTLSSCFLSSLLKIILF